MFIEPKRVSERADETFDGLAVGGVAEEAKGIEAADEDGGVLGDGGGKAVAQALAHARRDRAHHAEVEEDKLVAGGVGLDQDVAGVRIGVEVADFEHLGEVRLREARGELVAVDVGGVERGDLGDLDAVHPFEDEDAAGGVVFEDLGDADARVIGEDGGEALGVLALLHVVELLGDGAAEFAVEAAEVGDAVGGGDEQGDDAEDEAQGAQVGADDGVDAGALDFEGDGAPIDQPRLVDLAERGGAGGDGIDAGADLLPGLTPLTFEHGDDVLEALGGHFVVEGGELVERLLRQQVGTRAEELAELDQQAAEGDGGEAEVVQDADELLDVGADIHIAACVGFDDAGALAVDDVERAEQ